jgi:F0F1-type ATP synthase gamma subunit
MVTIQITQAITDFELIVGSNNFKLFATPDCSGLVAEPLETRHKLSLITLGKELSSLFKDSVTEVLEIYKLEITDDEKNEKLKEVLGKSVNVISTLDFSECKVVLPVEYINLISRYSI